MERKANFFWNDLQSSDSRENAKTWREKLRRVRSQNDMNKAVPQPPLSPIRDSDEDEFQVWDEFQIWETSRELSCDDVITGTTGNEDYQESVVIMETFL